MHFDPSTRRNFYYNTNTHRKQWEPPEGWIQIPPPTPSPPPDETLDSRKRTRTSLSAATFKIKTLKPRSDSELFGRNEAKNTAVAYLKECTAKSSKVFDSLSGKYSMLGVSGVKGIGKTELLAQICTKWVAEALGTSEARAVYLSYSGGGSAGPYCQELEAIKNNIRNGHWIDSLGHLLLVTHGVEELDAIQVPISDALDFIWQKLFGANLNLHDSNHSAGQLVICVDEIVHLDVCNKLFKVEGMTMAQKMMSECMSLQDKEGGKIIFIFTAILQSMYTELKTLSGREIQPLPLSTISLSDVFDRLISSSLRHLAKKQPAVYQLILSCAGHPRATVDGLPYATSTWCESDSISTASLITARNKVVEKCKFDLTYINQGIIKEWFRIEGPSDQIRQQLLECGILQSVESDVEFLFPLLLHQWALENKRSTYGHHLSELFDADLILDSNTEKFMEAVMYHYEAVLRKSMDGKEFDLKDFYRTENVGDNFKQRIVTAKVPPAIDLVRVVKDFQDMDEVLRHLRAGFLAVSNLQNEKGVEYLAPYHEWKKLVVACVQCKFVQDSVSWSDIKWKMNLAVKWLKKKKIENFPVVYTTSDQKTMKKKTYADGVYMIEKDIFEFTSRLGILRLHTQKLGGVLANIYPFLQGARL